MMRFQISEMLAQRWTRDKKSQKLQTWSNVNGGREIINYGGQWNGECFRMNENGRRDHGACSSSTIHTRSARDRVISLQKNL